jgi:hypothetical protein
LYEVTTSSSKPLEVGITPVGRGELFLPNHMTFVLEVLRTRLIRAEKAFNTKSREGPVEYKTVSAAYKWIRGLPTA